MDALATLHTRSQDDSGELDRAAAEMARLVEEHFDEMGWSEGERNSRVASAGKRISVAAERAKSAESLAIAATAE